MNAERLGRLTRLLRIRQRLTQAALASRAGVSRRAVSDLECGRARRLPLASLEAIAIGLGARIDLRLSWNGPELDRLLDAGHAAIGASVKRRLERWGWLVRVEVSYNRYGERGRIDLLAWHPMTGTLLVLEIKTELVDAQELLGSIDVKVRLARHVAERFGWAVTRVVPGIVFLEHPGTRARLDALTPLFDRFDRRGRAAQTWLRQPSAEAPHGLLWFTAVRPSQRGIGAARRVYGPRAGGPHNAPTAHIARDGEP